MTLRSLPLLALTLACSSLQSRAVPTTAARYAPYRGRVIVSMTRDPAGATELGIVEAQCITTIEDAIPEFVERVAQLGGDYARIDRVNTRYEWVSRPITQTYNCGSARYPSYCTRTTFQNDEIATLRVSGRAFRVGAQ